MQINFYFDTYGDIFFLMRFYFFLIVLFDLYCSTITMDFSQLNRGYLMPVYRIQNKVGEGGGSVWVSFAEGVFSHLKDQHACRGRRGFERVGFVCEAPSSGNLT